jgi:chorismate synthase
MMRYLTAGESHGKGLVIIIDGVPANLELTQDDIDKYLSARQLGYGRGARQKIETDKAEIISGLRFGRTTGAPLSFIVKNRDFQNWAERMDAYENPVSVPALNVPRPGHADLPGAIKFNQKDLRNVLERASARETAARIIAGAVAKKMLEKFGVDVFGYVKSIGKTTTDIDDGLEILKIKKLTAGCDKKTGAQLRFPDIKKAPGIIKNIDSAIRAKDTLGGVVKVVTSRLPIGLGDYTQWDKKLDARLAMALMSLQSVKGVEIGAGFSYASGIGSEMHDEIFFSAQKGYYRNTNNSGGMEGGMTNGEPLVIRAALKPISTVGKGLNSVEMTTGSRIKTIYERSDVCAVPAGALIAESIVAFELALAFQQKFGGDEMEMMGANYENYVRYVKKFTGKK